MGTPEIGIDRDQDATCYVGELDQRVTEDLLWELFCQVGNVISVHIPRDKVINSHGGYGFVEFRTEEDADYCIKILNNIKLYGKPLKVNRAFKDKKTLDVGANLFIGNISPEATEKDLLDTFSRFGVIITTPKILFDTDSGNTKGYGFVSFDSFEASDAAIEQMNGQYLCGRTISVQYAIKKDSKSGERYGTPAERLLASKKIALRNKSVEGVLHTNTNLPLPMMQNTRSYQRPMGFNPPPNHMPPNHMPHMNHPNFMPPNQMNPY
eukprot:TRINITY_DN6253_c0_g1_i3.p1 TRINITY_DN6253_c0_g1~~TRINITY_DN6253_c0_g1_i3.p1  ORF type:complete len:278 (+),score=60.08 TRINITY_DN6253_c0_g1_i3:38-835(+)